MSSATSSESEIGRDFGIDPQTLLLEEIATYLSLVTDCVVISKQSELIILETFADENCSNCMSPGLTPGLKSWLQATMLKADDDVAKLKLGDRNKDFYPLLRIIEELVGSVISTHGDHLQQSVYGKHIVLAKLETLYANVGKLLHSNGNEVLGWAVSLQQGTQYAVW